MMIVTRKRLVELFRPDIRRVLLGLQIPTNGKIRRAFFKGEPELKLYGCEVSAATLYDQSIAVMTYRADARDNSVVADRLTDSHYSCSTDIQHSNPAFD